MKTKLTNDIEQALFKYVREASRVNFIIGELDIGYQWGIVDALQATINTNKITWRCYEIKVSKKDFYSKAKLTFVGHFNYYVMPIELYDMVKKDIPKDVGVLVYTSFVNMVGDIRSNIEVMKKPMRVPLKVPTEQLASRFITSSHRELYKLMRR